MENRKTFRVILIGFTIYMLLSWVITAGYFDDTGFVSSGFNQVGLFDFILAPLNLFNHFVASMTMNIDGYVNSFGYGNIILAFLSIGILYGVLNKTGAYNNLVNVTSKKLTKRREIFLLVVAFIYALISALSGLNLILFMFLPFIAAILMKLKYRRVVTFTATIGGMLVGQIGSLYNPTINGLNRIIFHTELNSNILVRIILFIMLVVILLATLLLSKNKDVKKEEEISLLEDDKAKKSFVPIIIITSVMTLILVICMYNWYYMFNITSVTNAYNKLINTEVANYNFMKNIFGISESFGYFSGFTMSALLILESIILTFIYNIKFEKMIDGVKNGIKDMGPSVLLGTISLSLIVLSLNNSESFIYSIVNRLLDVGKDSIVTGVFSSTFINSLFVHDYFAVISSLSTPITSTYGVDPINTSLFISQVSHGIASLITPFNVYLIAGLAYLKVSYTEWLKYFWKTLLVILGVSLIVVILVATII